jgi:glutamate-ammonia-ligase adenylyltransferase
VGERRELLARRLGLGDGAGLERALAEHRSRVTEVFATLTALVAPSTDEEAAPAEVALLLDRGSNDEARAAALRALGFRDVEAALEQIALLLRRPHSPFAPSSPRAHLAPLILAEVADSPDPDLALRRLVDLAGRRAAADEVWRFIDAGGRSRACS